MMKSEFGGQALYVVPEQEIVIACYNYLDSDWGMNLLSEKALGEIVAAMADK